MTAGTAAPPETETEVEEQDISLVTDDVDAPVEREDYVAGEPSAAQITAAHEALDRLEKRGAKLGAAGTITELEQVIDVIDPFKTPPEWPGKEGLEYHSAQVVHEIAVLLLAACEHLQLDKKVIICTWRNKEKWMDGSRPKRGDTTKHGAMVQHHLKGRLITLTINYHHWLTMNPLQKIAEVYHRLRERDAEGKKIPPQFTGYYDEPKLFGLRVFADNLLLAEACDDALSVAHQYALPLEDDPEDEEIH